MLTLECSFSIQLLVFRYLSKYLMLLVIFAIPAESTKCLCQLTQAHDISMIIQQT